MLVEHAKHGVFDLDGDGCAGVVEAYVHALADDLDTAAAGDSPLHSDGYVGRGGWWTGHTRAAQPGPVGGRQREGDGAPQLAVDDDVDQLRVQAQGDQPAGEG